MPVPDPARSRAVLIGVGTYASADLAPLPAAAGARRLAGLLCDSSVWGLPAEHVTVVGAEASPAQVLTAVRDAAKQATDTLLVYFAGYVLRDRAEETYLALADADVDFPQIGALSTRALGDVMRQAGSRARSRVTLLDCCCSAMSATAVSTDLEPAHTLHEPRGRQADDADDRRRDCVLTSEAPTRRSFSRPGAAVPEFTGGVINILEHGITGAGAALSMDDLWFHISRRMAVERGARGPRQWALNIGACHVLFRNRAATPDRRRERFNYLSSALVAAAMDTYPRCRVRVEDFLASPASALNGDSPTGDEVLLSVEYLCDKGLAVLCSAGELRLTGLGIDCGSEDKVNVREFMTNQPGFNIGTVNNYGGANQIGTHNTQHNAIGSSPQELTEFAQKVLDAAHTIDVPEDQRARLAEDGQALADEASSAAPEPGRVRQLVVRIRESLTQGATDAVAQGLLDAAQNLL